VADIDVNFIRQHAESVIKSTTIGYVKDVKLKGSLFGDDLPGVVCQADTSFFVDHDEPQAALNEYVARNSWVLGDLLDGHEFFVLIPLPLWSPSVFTTPLGE
jgi:hypothetical protein